MSATAAQYPLRTAPAGLGQTVRRLLAEPGRFRCAAAGVFCLSIALRIALLLAASPPLISDVRDYHAYAESLARGDGYVHKYVGETQAYRDFVFRAYRPAGYPFLLTCIYTIFGWKTQVALGLNAAAELVTQLCWLLIALRLLGPAAALVVQVLLAMHVLWTPLPMTESVFTALSSVLALLHVFGIPYRSAAGGLCCGGVLTAAVFVRPIAVCFLPVLLVGAVWRGPLKRVLPRVLTLVLPLVLALSAWGARNQRLFGQVVLFTTNLGTHNADDFGLGRDEMFAELRAAGLNEAQINREIVGREMAVIAERPLWWAGLFAERVRDLFSLRVPYEVGVTLWRHTFTASAFAETVGALHRYLYLQYLATYPAAAIGLAVLLLKRRLPWSIAALMLCFVVLHCALSRADIRLVAPIYPHMCLFASACILMIPGFRGLLPGSSRVPRGSGATDMEDGV